MDFNILKCHGSGNDFIMIDERMLDRNFNAEERQQMSVKLCNRVQGIGADGILFVLDDSLYDGRMIIYNADGSEASMCGNGLRCVVRLIAESKALQQMKIATKGGVYETEVIPQFFDEMNGYSIKIDNITFDADQMLSEPHSAALFNEPIKFLDTALKFSTVNAPNPHIIAPLTKPDTTALTSIGENCNREGSPFFDGVNINFFTPVKENVIFVETYERGVGLTNACGTGMVASTVIAHRLSHVPQDKWITVVNKGGFVRTRVESSGDHFSVHLLGNATYTFRGIVSYDFETTQYAYKNLEHFEHEIKQYESMVEYSRNVLQEL